MFFLGSSDASWGNAEVFKSQAGYFIWGTSSAILESESCHMSAMCYNSHKQHRIANSTLSAEAMALGETLDNLDYVNACWLELNDPEFDICSWVRELGQPGDPWKDRRSGVLTLDAKSLFDALANFGTSRPTCKRTCVEIAMISDLVTKSGHLVKWVPTDVMLADALTKCGDQATLMVEVMGDGKYQLVNNDCIAYVLWILGL